MVLGAIGLVEQLRGAHGDVHDVELVGQRLDDDPVTLEVAPHDRLADRGPGQLEPAGPQVGDGRHLGDLDLLAGALLDAANLPVLARLGQRDGDALAARPADAADPVDVRLGLGGDVEVDDVREVLDVEPARGDVGGDQEVGRLAAELLHHAIALLLRHPAVQGLGAVAARVERLGQLVDLVAAAAEDDGRGRVLDVEHAAERRELVAAGDDVRGLPDQRHGRPRPSARRAILIRTGSVRCRLAIAEIRGGSVAEKRTVCRSFGVSARIDSMSSAKPMSSISSASSRTTTATPSSLSVLRRMRSRARPGVAMTTSTPRSRARNCGPYAWPP